MSEEQEKTHAIKAVSIRKDGLIIIFQVNGCIVIECGQCGDDAFTDIIEIMGGHA